MCGAPTAGSATPAPHFEQSSAVRSKPTPHIEHILGGDASFTSHVGAGVLAAAGTWACECDSARNRRFFDRCWRRIVTRRGQAKLSVLVHQLFLRILRWLSLQNLRLSGKFSARSVPGLGLATEDAFFKAVSSSDQMRESHGEWLDTTKIVHWNNSEQRFTRTGFFRFQVRLC